MTHKEKFDTLLDAIWLARFAHHKQVDKLGNPYFGHVHRVYETVKNQGAPVEVQIAAILHDSTEDTLLTPQMLLDLGVPAAAVEIVKLVDRDISYEAFKEANSNRDIGGKVNGRYWYLALGPEGANEFYYEQIREHPGAVQVKLADIEDNLQPWRLAYLPDETQARLREKYAGAIRALN